jgi:hypothetical protein
MHAFYTDVLEAKSREARIKIAVGVSVAVLALLLAVAALLIWSRRRLTRTAGNTHYKLFIISHFVRKTQIPEQKGQTTVYVS